MTIFARKLHLSNFIAPVRLASLFALDYGDIICLRYKEGDATCFMWNFASRPHLFHSTSSFCNYFFGVASQKVGDSQQRLDQLL
uniref:Uncharacterized protein n=2 Tax=Parascaris univalens TaxID=6257 RepID=A0A915BTG7_PARUN